MSYAHILKSTGLLGSTQVLTVLISVVRNKVAALLIGPAGMGLADLYARTVELMAGGTHFGLGMSGVRTLSVYYERGDRLHLTHQVRLVRTWVFLTALLGAVLTLACAPLLSRWISGDGRHTLDILLLAPAVGFTTLTGGEVAILRSIRRLKSLALAATIIALSTLAVCIPTYLAWGIDGVVLVVLLTTLITFGVHLARAWRDFPYRIHPLRLRFLRSGLPLLRLGLAFVGASLMSNAAEMMIRTTLTNAAGLAMAGLYAAGLTLTVSYVRIVFVAMEADYFPRLSTASGDTFRQNEMVNDQTDVLLQVMTPILLLFSLCLPLMVRLLYSRDFLPVMPMVWAALPYMFFKALYSPMAYLPLAKGASGTFAGMELIYNVFLAVLVIAGYHLGGLLGTGVALSLANALDFLLIWRVYRRRFGMRLYRSTVRTAMIQGTLLLAGLVAVLSPVAPLRYGIGVAACLLSAGYCIHHLRLRIVGDRSA